MRFRTTGVMMAALATAGLLACGSSDSGSSSGSVADAGSGSSDAGVDSGNAVTLPLKASNIDLKDIDLSKIADEDVATNCQIRADGTSDCFAHAAFGTVVQSDSSKIGVYVVKSLRIEPTAHIDVNALSGNLPVAVVSLGDFVLMGTIDAHGQDVHGNAGGFQSIIGQKGSGPGGGAAASASTGGSGASYCGVGGQGAVVINSGATAGARSPASGTPEIVPLRGGASGGSGDPAIGGAGGGGVQLVAAGAFSMATGSYVNVGGGGGGFGGNIAAGGGAGGSILIEATTVKIAGTLAANGGGGGGAGAGYDDGKNGSADATAAAGGPGTNLGGKGSAGASIDGADAPAPAVDSIASGGGGGAGRIRINSTNGQADLTGAVLSPAAATPCVTQGTLK